MKKKEIILFSVIIVLSLFCLYFFNKSRTSITVGEYKYQEQGGVNYKVYLNDNNYYNADYLDEGMQYISTLVDHILLDYKYNIYFDTDKKFNVSKKLQADVKIVDTEKNDKVIFSKQEVLKSENLKDTKTVGINEEINLDYNKYNDLINEFKSKYGINANCNLYVNYTINYESTDGEIKDSRVIRIEAPLSKQMITINKTNNVNKTASFIGKTSKMINKIMLTLAIVFTVLTVSLILLLVYEITSRIKHTSKYDRYISRLLREYDSYITNSDEAAIVSDKNTFKLESFKELLDVRNTVDKPIVYNKISDDESMFVIISNDVLYQYVVNRKDME